MCRLPQIKSGYWQVPIKAEDREKTAFITNQGLYQFLVMPFGLKNALATFQRLMNEVLRNVKGTFCEVYLDDIIIYSSTIAEHLKHQHGTGKIIKGRTDRKIIQKPFLQTGRIWGLYFSIINLEIDNRGIMTELDKVEAVSKFETPKNTKQLSTF